MHPCLVRRALSADDVFWVMSIHAAPIVFSCLIRSHASSAVGTTSTWVWFVLRRISRHRSPEIPSSGTLPPVSFPVQRRETPIAALSRTGYVHRLAVLGHGAAGHLDPVRGQFGNQLLVTERMLFIFAVDDLLELQPNGVPRNLRSIGADRAAAEEPLQRKDATRRLDPFVVDGPTDRGHVDTHFDRRSAAS